MVIHTTFNQERYLSLLERVNEKNHNSDDLLELRELENLRPWTPNEQYLFSKKVAKDLREDFVLDEYNSEVFKALCLYFTNDKRFEERGFGSLKKGLMLMGNVGVGKSFLMNVFSLNKRACFRMTNCDQVVYQYQTHGVEGVKDYYSTTISSAYKHNYFFQSVIGLCFDDIGIEESPAKNFGNSMNVLEKIILFRYENSIPFHLTHFTTNLDGKEIELKYGTRVRSRIREMCNFIDINGTDRRK